MGLALVYVWPGILHVARELWVPQGPSVALNKIDFDREMDFGLRGQVEGTPDLGGG